jgi:hypothetical protein
MKTLITYQDGELEINVSIEQETVWLNRNQLSELFDRDVKTIGKHINNDFKDQELDKISVVANFATTASDGQLDIESSLKDLGKKVFAFSKIDINPNDILKRV